MNTPITFPHWVWSTFQKPTYYWRSAHLPWFGMESDSSYTCTMCTIHIYILLFWFPVILCLQSKLPSMTFSPNSTTFDFYTFILLSPYIFITQNMHTLILYLDTKTYSCPFLKCEIFFSFLEATGHPSNPLFCLQSLCFGIQNIGSVGFPIICIFQWPTLKGQKNISFCPLYFLQIGFQSLDQI